MISFNFSHIEKEFNELFFIMKRKIITEWTEKYPNLGNGRLLVFNYFQLALNYHKTVDVLCDDVNKDKFLSLSVTPLVRSVFEILYILIYFFDDVPERTKFFLVTMYREQKRLLDIWEKNYGNIPEWKDRIKETKNFLDKIKPLFKNDFGQVAFESVDWDNLKNVRFPSLGKIKESFKVKNPEMSNFLQFLDDMWYRELSVFSHCEPFCLVQIQPILLDRNLEQLKNFKNENFWLSLTSIMCIASEIEIALNFGLKNELNHIWKVIINHSSTPKEIYEMRYQKLLN